MAEQFRWAGLRIKCPEGRGETELFLEWRVHQGKEVLNSITCKNPQLRDLSGSDCQWSCWEKISPQSLP